jgi:DNA-binding MurR/RpiR family transcriptional regulator
VVATTTPTSGSLDERLAARGRELSPAERRVASFFAAHPEEAAFLSAADIAQKLETSDATVVRSAQSLGYSGLPELKRELVAALRERATPASRLGTTLDDLGSGPGEALDHVLTLQIGLLEEARRTLRREEFARAVDLLGGARRVLIYGTGPLEGIAEYGALRLARFCRQAIALAQTGRRFADDLLGITTGDAVLLMTYGEVNSEVELLLEHAASLGVPVLLLTDTLGAAYAGRVSVTLSARRARTGEWSTAATTLVVLDALLFGLAARDRPRTIEALELLKDLRARIAGRKEG